MYTSDIQIDTKLVNRVPFHKVHIMSGIITELYYLNLANVIVIFMFGIIIIIIHCIL